MQIGKALEKNPNIKVIYTRKTDVFVNFVSVQELQIKLMLIYLCLFIVMHIILRHSGTETFVVGAANSKRNLDIAKEENEVIFLEDDYAENYEGFDPNSPESLLGLTLMQEEYVDQSIMLASLNRN